MEFNPDVNEIRRVTHRDTKKTNLEDTTLILSSLEEEIFTVYDYSGD